MQFESSTLPTQADPPKMADVCCEDSVTITATTASCGSTTLRNINRAWAEQEQGTPKQRCLFERKTALRRTVLTLRQSDQALKHSNRGTCGIPLLCLPLELVVTHQHLFAVKYVWVMKGEGNNNTKKKHTQLALLLNAVRAGWKVPLT